MSLRRFAVLAVVAALLAPGAFAQDDLFVPLELEPVESLSKPKPKPAKRRAKKTPPAKKPPPKPAAEAEDDLAVPMVAQKTGLLVKLGGGVKGARLFLDSTEVGVLPLDALEVTPGEHTVAVRRPGYADFIRRITVAPGKTAEVAVSLNAVAGVVAVSSDVASAQVAIDGQPKGAVPLTGIVLKPGSHEIVVSREGFEPDKQRITVRAGKDYTVTAYLRPLPGASIAPVARADTPKETNLMPPEPAVTSNPSPLAPLPQEAEASASRPWFKRWYVWAGVGAVVTAAAVGAVVATQGSGGDPLAPETVCGRQCDAIINGARPF
ncbi:PEGA domain-containing protein [Stigmatella sp. ncwal1]|uniref:PEGA domain-containing protein n=1 Tax=Stigmatella ashevillensis TaxID=2995309 RepID=A0ABT5D7U1_9BACT|nr:PEGA domain-containing protein [Stigmatella ashevillena]MDC0709737.1 PEGA domain-containing protein [Stigmatella ashevillena]